MALTEETLTEEFGIRVNTLPVLKPEAYRLLLEKLLAEGQGFGKTKNIAAYKLRNIHLATERKNGVEEQQIQLPDLYVVMDMSVWRNEYIRKLGMQDIAVKWAKRIVSEGEINSADFKGPGIWTTKRNSFEFDYIHAGPVTEYDSTINSIYTPNLDAYRLCVTVTEPVNIPTPWGKPYPIDIGGAVAIRECDVEELANALKSIREGHSSILNALYKKTEDGKLVTRFDVYGMEPGFLSDNYDPVELKPETKELTNHFVSLTDINVVVANNDEPMIPQLEKIMTQHTFADIPKDGAVFWGKGGGSIVDIDLRQATPFNDELAQNFITTQNLLNGDGCYTDMLDILDPYGSNWIESTGRGSRLLPRDPRVLSHFERVDFWRRISTRFVNAAEGTIHVAAANANANSNFRLFEYPAIMANDRITRVQAVEGQLRRDGLWPYVNLLTKKFERHSTRDEYAALEAVLEKGEMKVIFDGVIFNEDLKTMPKTEWAEWQKQQWLDNSLSRLLSHLEGRHRKTQAPDRYNTYFPAPEENYIDYARTAFVTEIIFSLREAERLRNVLANGDLTAAQSLEREKARLSKAYQVLEQYPDILNYSAPPLTICVDSPSARAQIFRKCTLIQEVGEMLIAVHEKMSLDDKNRLWGRYNRFDFFNSRYDPEDSARFAGQPEQMEYYVGATLAGLKDKIRQTLAQTAPPHEIPAFRELKP